MCFFCNFPLRLIFVDAERTSGATPTIDAILPAAVPTILAALVKMLSSVFCFAIIVEFLIAFYEPFGDFAASCTALWI